jgi:outer membrane autotransporter protein
MAAVVNSVYDLANDRAVEAMGSMSGVVHQHAAAATIADAQTFMDVTMAHMGETAGRAAVPTADLALNSLFMEAAPGAPSRGAWFSGVGRLSRYAATDGDPAAKASSVGFAVGYDTAIGSHLVLGASAGETAPQLDLDGRGDRATSRTLHGGVYGRYERAASRLAVIFGGSGGAIETTRAIDDGLGLWGAHARYDGRNVYSRIEYGQTLSLGRALRLQPEAGFQYVRVHTDGFTEDGAGVLDLLSPARQVSSRRSLVGARLDRLFGSQAGANTTFQVRAAWAHEFDPMGAMRMQFAGDNAANGFDVTSPARLNNGAVFGASLFGKATRRISFLTSFDADLSRRIKLWTASAGLRAAW